MSPLGSTRFGAVFRRQGRERQNRPEAVLERFTARLGPSIPADELLLQLVEALKASLRATRAEAWLVVGDELERNVSVPHIGEGEHFALGAKERRRLGKANVYGISWARVWLPPLLAGRPACSLRIAPVVNDGEALGLLAVERGQAEDFTPAEEAALSELARHLGLSLHNERLRADLEATLAEVRRANAELRASRARVVETADAERRRIERDLHDGAQQRLIALAMELRGARDALDRVGDDGVAERLARADESVAEAMAELTDLAHGIYPPILREAGLDAALRGVARRHPTPVRLEAGGLGRREAPIETAIYFAVVEALQNAAKHAPDADIKVTVAEREGGIRFEVVDDGPGFDPGAVRQGHGMLNVADRIGAVGGTVRWESAPGAGARLHGAVPAAPEASGP